jgi:hypothetical protein
MYMGVEPTVTIVHYVPADEKIPSLAVNQSSTGEAFIVQGANETTVLEKFVADQTDLVQILNKTQTTVRMLRTVRERCSAAACGDCRVEV